MTHSLHLSDLLPGPGVKAPENLEAETLDHVTEALTVLGALLPLNGRDFSADPLDAVLYGVLVGWGCEEHPASGPHDKDCGGDDAFDEVADNFGWSPAQRERIRTVPRRGPCDDRRLTLCSSVRPPRQTIPPLAVTARR